MAILLQSMMTFYPFYHLACVVSIPFGYFLFTISIIQCMKHDLKLINQMVKKSKKSTSDIFKQLSIFIHSHTEIKQLSAHDQNV